MLRGTAVLDFGHAIRELRTGRKLSMADAAAFVGVHRTTLQRWEKNQAEPRLVELEALLEALRADAKQKQQLLACLNAPRARVRVRSEIVQIAEKHDLGMMPNGGDLLRAMRMRRGWTIEEVAARMQISTRTLRRWENAEIWPSVETLHRLCQILSAREEEIVALICGTFAASSEIQDVKADKAVDDVERFWSAANLHSELEYLNLIAQTWRFAAQKASLRLFLARSYLMYADYLSLYERWQEVGRYASDAMRLRSRSNISDPGWVIGAITLAHHAVHGGAQPNPSRGLEMLRPWMTLAEGPVQQAWLEARLAEYLLLSGATETALFEGARACQIARQEGLSLELQRRSKDQGVLLLKAGRPSEALSLFQSVSDDSSALGIDIQLWQVKALLALKENNEAHARLLHVQKRITTGQWSEFQQHIDVLAAQV